MNVIGQPIPFLQVSNVILELNMVTDTEVIIIIYNGVKRYLYYWLPSAQHWDFYKVRDRHFLTSMPFVAEASLTCEIMHMVNHLSEFKKIWGLGDFNTNYILSKGLQSVPNCFKIFWVVINLKTKFTGFKQLAISKFEFDESERLCFTKLEDLTINSP